MKTKLTLTLLAFATVSLNLHAAPSQALPAPLPEFMDDAQAAKWTADQEATAQTTSAQEPSNQFYTGKPYVADAGGYIYKYRTYNPEMSRWTSADPSGFPDGVNNDLYVTNPTSQFDAEGLSPDPSTIISDPRDSSGVYQAVLKAGNPTINITYQLTYSLTSVPTLVGAPTLGGTGTTINALIVSDALVITGTPTVSNTSSTPGTYPGTTNPDITYVGTLNYQIKDTVTLGVSGVVA
jgi:RHS repeat-associated protein